jgi:hypothetical protein
MMWKYPAVLALCGSGVDVHLPAGLSDVDARFSLSAEEARAVQKLSDKELDACMMWQRMTTARGSISGCGARCWF